MTENITHLDLLVLSYLDRKVGEALHSTISEDQTKVLDGIIAQGLTEIANTDNRKNLIGDPSSEGGFNRNFSHQKTENKTDSSSPHRPGPSQEPESDEDDTGRGKGWEKKPNYGFTGPLPAVPDPPLWKDDPPKWLDRKTDTERRELEKVHQQPSHTVSAEIERNKASRRSSTLTYISPPTSPRRDESGPQLPISHETISKVTLTNSQNNMPKNVKFSHQDPRSRHYYSDSDSALSYAGYPDDGEGRSLIRSRSGSLELKDEPNISVPRSMLRQNTFSSGTSRGPPEPAGNAEEAVVDWRSQVCTVLNASQGTNDRDLLSSLLGLMKDGEAATDKKTKKKTSKPPPTYEILHRVECAKSSKYNVYYDSPNFDESKSGSKYHLRGNLSVSEDDLSNLSKGKTGNLSFLIFKEYQCCQKHDDEWGDSWESSLSNDSPPKKGARVIDSPQDLFIKDTMQLISEGFCVALRAMSKLTGRVPACYPEFVTSAKLEAPYAWYYIDRHIWKDSVESLKKKDQRQITMFMKHANEHNGNEYEEIDSLLERGFITPKYLDCLFIPQQLIVTNPSTKSSRQSKGGSDLIVAYRQLSKLAKPIKRGSEDRWYDDTSIRRHKQPTCRQIKYSYWDFDGNFQENQHEIDVEYDDAAVGPFPISGLNVYPLKYADESIKAKLIARGKMFWACRERKYVYYTNTNRNKASSGLDGRFMVDIATYKRMHPGNSMNISQFEDNSIVSQDEPPGGDFLSLLPPTVLGFNMQEKKWLTLPVDHLSDVKWNKQAFDSLVVDAETKTLITAMVTNQIDAEKNTDLISDKGNGLIVLLHGGPGTGKTLTAESVAELSEKPLYRVTCGDIGTDPEAVEKYLKTVLHLGKVWGCVVLLDEADVFLEQRTLSDLQRNALVSVFLRVLEYYDGILILTSNRVGTFDEAFKSRIQLSLRYENLTRPQRLQVWENFINRLENFDDGEIDLDDIRAHTKELAAYNMNGRHIRNAITTARQLARYKKAPMSYADLVHVINVAGKFDKYLLEMHAGVSEDGLAREYAIR
ncbi:P-loop containing nucleoside triphosphate hydrolase [Glarea lozoyensis ATCC 20868]|uniref:p-loop containing nucleoside triphosphate hydrolase n=1 Tax=Glarea lozoyensis (strain ATCC 20868 / MF5171) TaxID=1116229 RepID=S3E5E9_GLAL2|nr:P-loop containing nucleoside triphosphate hydrolase [Glarea lozoyensis ATCC 20868]EPE33628.1 P-loop containing nucleoside triphosphate hydrolase [Glarea lozoyensis ATCC 20868]